MAKRQYDDSTTNSKVKSVVEKRKKNEHSVEATAMTNEKMKEETGISREGIEQ